MAEGSTPRPMRMEDSTIIPLLEAIIARERQQGCPMATETLIAPAIRRWRSYERRYPRHKDRSLAHRAADLEKGLQALYPNHRYDPGCLQHLAQSFAEVLMDASSAEATRPPSSR